MEQIFSVEEAAKVLQIAPNTMRRYVRTGKVRAAKLGKAYRITESDLMTFLDSQTKDNYINNREK